jgi:hypothetical protein
LNRTAGKQIPVSSNLPPHLRHIQKCVPVGYHKFSASRTATGNTSVLGHGAYVKMKSLSLAATLLLITPLSHAAFVTFGFDGKVGYGNLTNIPASTELSGYYTIDTETPGDFFGFSSDPKFVYANAVVDFELNILGTTVSSSGEGSKIEVANDARSGYYTYDSYVVDIGNLVNDIGLQSFRLSFSRRSSDPLQLLTDNSIQATAPDFSLDSGGSNGTLLGAYNHSNSIYLNSLAVIETPLVATPLPAGIILFGSGLIGLFGFSVVRKSESTIDKTPTLKSI